jgi:putative RNA 2'-phosphotransferase
MTLDGNGWADVGELLRCAASSKRPMTFAELQEVVRCNNKQRYSFNSDATKIRANQGHSIDVDVEPEEKDPPERLYHGTASRFLDSISKSGLTPQKRLHVHLSSDAETAHKVGSRHGNPIVLVVRAKEMAEDGFKFWLSKNGVWLAKSVPPKYFSKQRE